MPVHRASLERENDSNTSGQPEAGRGARALIEPMRPRLSPKNQNARVYRASGAGEGIRTLDVNLGKVALYH
jgi:hypothetical protein